MLYNWTARDSSGKVISDVMEAKDRKELMQKLRQRQLIVTNVVEKKAAAAKKSFALFGKKVKTDDIVIFSRQLATMIDSGLPLVQSLDILTRQTKNLVLKNIILRVKEDIEVGGQPLSQAMSKHPQVFSSLFANMVKAGEVSGTLDTALNQLAEYLEKAGAIKKEIKSAMIYPMLIGTMSVGIGLVLLLYVVPMFKDIYAEFGGQLPGPTQILITLSDLFKKYFLLFIIVFIGGGIFAFRYSKTPRGRLLFDKAKLRIPVIGDLVRKIAISKVTRTLGTLVRSGVPILEALLIVGKTSENMVIERAIDEAHQQVRDGESITAPLMRTGVFPPMVTEMISVGEETGELEKMLNKVADFYDQQVASSVAALTSTIEPLMIGILGVGIGGMVIALYLPIFKMSQLVGG